MGLHFDHNRELHMIFFLLEGDSESGDDFAGRLRAKLDPEIGKPEVPSAGSKMSWKGRSADNPPHETEVNLDLDPGGQTVAWEDLTRYRALEKALRQ
jgi:hypothetical protein